MSRHAKGNYIVLLSGGEHPIYGHKPFYDHRVVEINGKPTEQVQAYFYGELGWVDVTPSDIVFFKES